MLKDKFDNEGHFHTMRHVDDASLYDATLFGARVRPSIDEKIERWKGHKNDEAK